MGTNEELQACKREGSSSPPPKQDPLQQTSDHVYADWAALQAYYGPALSVPTYSNPTNSSPHFLPPYMLRPTQHVMPAYAALYQHGGLFAQPGVHVTSSPADIDSPAMSSEDDKGLIKKLKRSDGFATSISNGNRDSGKDSEISHSEGSDGNTTEGDGLKRSTEELPITSGASSKITGVTVASAKVLPKVEGAISPNPVIRLNLKEFPYASANMTSSIVNSTPHRLLLQNDRRKLRREKRRQFIREAAIRPKSLIQDERELKREWRKQCNREAAIRSRLKKQAVEDQLAAQVEVLNTDNLSLKSEINRLTINSEKLKLQNAKLMERLNTHKEQAAEDSKKVSSFSTANLLPRVDNSSVAAS
ncbi:common plant regulatory factor 1-like protein isoform X1 [Tanacetum coccineum]